MDEHTIAWEAPEYELREKSVGWYWISIILAAIVIAFAVWTKNFLFGFFIVIAEILFIVWGNRPPQTIPFAVEKDQLVVNGRKTYLLRDFESMSVNPLGDEWAEIILIAHAKFRTPLHILFPEARLAELRALVKPIFKETPYEPALLDAIEKLLHF